MARLVSRLEHFFYCFSQISPVQAGVFKSKNTVNTDTSTNTALFEVDAENGWSFVLVFEYVDFILIHNIDLTKATIPTQYAVRVDTAGTPTG